MKIVRTLGLAVVAAMALIAVAGAGTALAGSTTLCKTAATPFCAAGNNYAAKTAIEAKSDGIVTINNSIANIKCGESTLKAENSAETGDPLALAVSSWTLGKCGMTAAMNDCTSSTETLSSEGSVLWGKGSNGSLTLAGGKGVGWHFKCEIVGLGVFIDCTFTLNPQATLEGGSPAHITIPESAMSASGSLCPKTTTLKGTTTYGVVSPSPVYVASAEVPGTQLCKSSSSPCSEANTYPSGTSIVMSATNFKIQGPVFNYTCEKASLTLKTQSMTGKLLLVTPTAFSLGFCKSPGGGCGAKANILTPKTPTGIEWTGGESGTLKNLALSWEFQCGISPPYFETTFETKQEFQAPFGPEGGTTRLMYNNAPALTCKGYCQASSSLTATFVVSSPTPLYVTHF